MVDVEHHHLRRPAGGSARLDGAGRRIRAAHERHRAGRGPAGGQQFLRRPDPGQVEPGARAALEDEPFLPVPVEDRLHRVVDREDETGRHLLRRGRADVEPDRAVEAEDLVQQHVAELVGEHGGVRVGGEVPEPGAGGRVAGHHPVDDLLETPLALLGAAARRGSTWWSRCWPHSPTRSPETPRPAARS